jgi:hypothetical protein
MWGRSWLACQRYTSGELRKNVSDTAPSNMGLIADRAEIDLDLTLLTTRESGDMTLKLSGTGYARRIGDLHRSNPFLPTYEDGTPESWCVGKHCHGDCGLTNTSQALARGGRVASLLLG